MYKKYTLSNSYTKISSYLYIFYIRNDRKSRNQAVLSMNYHQPERRTARVGPLVQVEYSTAQGIAAFESECAASSVMDFIRDSHVAGFNQEWQQQETDRWWIMIDEMRDEDETSKQGERRHAGDKWTGRLIDGNIIDSSQQPVSLGMLLNKIRLTIQLQKILCSISLWQQMYSSRNSHEFYRLKSGYICVDMVCSRSLCDGKSRGIFIQTSP